MEEKKEELIYPTKADVIPVKDGISSLGDAVQMVLSVPQTTDPFSYCVYVHLSSDSVPHGTIKGLLTLLQLPKVDESKPDSWVTYEIYECPKEGCGGILTDDLRMGLHWMCPVCKELASVDPELIPPSGQYENRPVRRVKQTYFAFGAETWGDVLAEYVNRLWKMRKTSDQNAGYRVMVLVRRPRHMLQKLTSEYVTSGSIEAERNLLRGRSGHAQEGVEYSMYSPDSIAKDLESGTSLAKRLEVFIRGC